MTTELWNGRVGRRGFLRGAALGGVGLATAAVIGCGDDDDEPAATATTAPGATAAPSTSTPEVVKTITVTQGRANKPPSMDPNTTALAPAEFFAVFDPLTRLDEGPDGTSPGPALAESWELDADKRWVFKLREAEWSDGQPFTAEDVKFSFEYFANADNKSSLISRVNTIEQTEVMDPRTVRITNKSGIDPIMPRRGALPFILPKHIFEDASKDAKTFMAATPVGTGSYQVTNFVSDASVTFEASPNSWRGNKGVIGGTTRWIAESTTLLAALETGDLDIVQGIPSSENARVRGFKNITLQAANPLGAQHWDHANRLSEGHPANDKRVRQALTLAIDSPTIAEVIYSGLAEVAPGQITHKATFGFDPSLQATKFDPDGARQLLKDAGFANGFDFQIDSQMVGDTKPMVEATAGMWDDIGLKTSIVPLEINIWRDRLYGRTTAPWPGTFNVGWVAYLYDASFLYDWYNGGTAYRMWDVDDPTQKEFDGHYKAALAEPDDEKRLGLFQNIAKLFSFDGASPVTQTVYVNSEDAWRSDKITNHFPGKFPEMRFDEIVSA